MNPFQHSLRRHIALRESDEADRFWRRQIEYLQAVVHARQANRGRFDPSRAEELVAQAMAELVTNAWRTFQGSSEAELRAFLRGILLHRESDEQRRLRQDEDLAYRRGTDQVSEAWPPPADEGELPGFPELAPPPRELGEDDLQFLARLTAHNLCQQDLARELGTSESTVSRRYARIRREAGRLEDLERDRFEAWLRREK